MISDAKAKVVDAILSSLLCRAYFGDTTATDLFALNDRVLLSVMKTVLRGEFAWQSHKEMLIKLTQEFEAQIAVEDTLLL